MIEILQRSYTYIQIHWFAANTLQARDFSSKLLETCASIVRDFNAQDRKYCAKSRCLFQIATLLERKWDSRSTCKKPCPLSVYFSQKKNVPKTLPVDDHPMTGFAGHSRRWNTWRADMCLGDFTDFWHGIIRYAPRYGDTAIPLDFPFFVSNSNWVSRLSDMHVRFHWH